MGCTSGTLMLGHQPITETAWKTGCSRLGIVSGRSIVSGKPTMPDLKAFFASSYDWLYFQGHFDNIFAKHVRTGTLSNDDDSVRIDFFSYGVDVTVGKEKTGLRKSDGTFALHNSAIVILWGGCSVLGDILFIRTMRDLFEKPLMIGFKGVTGPRVVQTMLGAGFLKKAFFDRIQDPENLIQVCNSWMDTALQGYGGTKKSQDSGYGDVDESLFGAIDPDGREWMLENNKVVGGCWLFRE